MYIITFEPIPEWLLDALEEASRQILIELRIPEKLIGFEYLVCAVSQTAENPHRTAYITKDLYPDIARLYRTNGACVERSMRTAVQACWSNPSGRAALEQIAGFRLTSRPANAAFIDIVAEYIRSHM